MIVDVSGGAEQPSKEESSELRADHFHPTEEKWPAEEKHLQGLQKKLC